MRIGNESVTVSERITPPKGQLLINEKWRALDGATMPTTEPERGPRRIIALSCLPIASPCTVFSTDPAAPFQATTLARSRTVRWGM